MKIDAVIPWVDGNDPAHQERIRQYGPDSIFKMNDVAGATRYANLGEIFWCVASLNRFAPFLNKIYIITDEQDPHLEGFLEKNFPARHIPIEIVDHKTIFRGYEEYLPTFNAHSIETVLWRIPGLSEHFLLLNDDFLVIAPVSEKDFFTPDGRAICYGEKFSTLGAKAQRAMRPRKRGHRHVSYKGSMLNAAAIVGEGRYFLRIDHTPRPLIRSFYEDFFDAHPEVLLQNIRYRFRDASQFNSQELLYLSLYREGRCELTPVRSRLFFLQPKKKYNYVDKKMRKLESGGGDYLFCCFNSFCAVMIRSSHILYRGKIILGSSKRELLTILFQR